uniref:Uncharacterized protein n=1 Tax=Rhizophora mucronata TaxID=61149 RepID=A0A2P2LKD8_RHIMU
MSLPCLHYTIKVETLWKLWWGIIDIIIQVTLVMRRVNTHFVTSDCQI